MKVIQYLSPSAIALWKKDRQTFYWRYLSPQRPPGDPQTQPMSIGSAFDARVKSFLHQTLFGASHADSNKFQFDAIFEAQVEPQHRDWARSNSEYVFEQYRSSGALKDLLLDLQQGDNQRFEFELMGVVHGQREGVQEKIQGVTLLGRPDLSYVNRHGTHIILDWKVNGYCSYGNTSPKPGYIKLRQGGGIVNKMHGDCMPMLHNGTMVNMGCRLETLDEDWAQQLSIYAWLLGEPIGGDQVYAIDQIVGASVQGSLPKLRIAEHRVICTPAWQHRLFAEICDIWEIVHSDHIFRDLSLEDSQGRCALLDKRVEMGSTPLAALLRGE